MMVLEWTKMKERKVYRYLIVKWAKRTSAWKFGFIKEVDKARITAREDFESFPNLSRW